MTATLSHSLVDRPPTARGAHLRVPLVVLSHLRWAFVFQRPQHLLTRLAKDFDVYFIEEPVFEEGTPTLKQSLKPGGVEVLTPVTSVADWGFNDAQMAEMKPLIAEFMSERGVVSPIVWLYTPMALPLVADLEPRAVVYDCMDDLASFKFAPPELLERERQLMALADVVFTGGPSLYEARKNGHSNIHCLPSAVDARHFEPVNLDANSPESKAANVLHREMGRPRLGFFGVIDERLDIDLVANVADARPEWQIVMVGPVVKIDPASLPQRANLHWVGMQRYESLPYLLAQWDVCLLPFALNEATRFISPTKTLEYLAGGKPVVSTPVHDVISLYGSAVRIGATPEDFVQAVEQVLALPASERETWRKTAQALVDGCTWDDTAHRMSSLLNVYARISGAEPIQMERSLNEPPLHVAPSEAAGVLLPKVVVPAHGTRVLAS